MGWYETLTELIDLRSFSSIWYWIVVAILWSTASHFFMGIPFDMVQRARRAGEGTQAMADLEALVQVNRNRVLYIMDVAGVGLVGFVAFVLSILAALGFWYGVEFAQAVFLILAPMTVVGLRAVSFARGLRDGLPEGAELCRQIRMQRLLTQFIGFLAIMVTALWGMWQNMHAVVF